MKEIVILGAGDFGKEVAWLIEDINRSRPAYIILGYLDDDKNKIGQVLNGYECLGPVSYLTDLNKNHNACAVIATQDGSVRKKFVDMFPDFDDWETLVHPSVNLSDTSTLGKGCIVCANNNISVNTRIGNQCIMNISVTIGHDCEIGDYVSVMSGSVVSGHVVMKQQHGCPRDESRESRKSRGWFGCYPQCKRQYNGNGCSGKSAARLAGGERLEWIIVSWSGFPGCRHGERII